MSKAFTFVFSVEEKDEPTFREWAAHLLESLSSQKPVHGGTVTGAGLGDSMTEADRLAEFVDSKGYDSEQIARGQA